MSLFIEDVSIDFIDSLGFLESVRGHTGYGDDDSYKNIWMMDLVFRNGLLRVGVDENTDSIKVKGTSFKDEDTSDEELKEFEMSNLFSFRELIGSEVSWLWHLTNQYDYTDGAQLEFVNDRSKKFRLTLIAAASAIRYNVYPVNTVKQFGYNQMPGSLAVGKPKSGSLALDNSNGIHDDIDAWAIEVNKIYSEIFVNGDDVYAWGPDDLVGAYVARDRLQAKIGQGTIPIVVESIDSLLLSFSERTGRSWLEAVGMPDMAGENWWWEYTPKVGPIKYLLEKWDGANRNRKLM